MGVTESFVVIYGPVWVNTYAPPEHSTKWMGILHTFSALGVITGYLVAGIVINFFSAYLSWRFAIQVQGVFQIPIALYFFCEDENKINVDNVHNVDNENEESESQFNQNNTQNNTQNNKSNTGSVVVPGEGDFKYNTSAHLENRLKELQQKNMNSNVSNKNTVRENYTTSQPNITPINGLPKISCQKNQSLSIIKLNRKQTRIDTVQMSNLSIYCSQAAAVLSNGLYICVTFGLCSIFFIVTGVQFWMTSYLIDILGNDPFRVIVLYSAISITAPLSGVIVGGTFADRYGGYKGKNTVKAIKLCIAFGMVAFVFAFPLGFLTSLIYITVLLWAFLFFGAAVIPVGTGIMVSSVRKDCQATSSSISQLIFNLFGYFFSPILTGYIMDGFDNKYNGFKWGMRVVFWWSIFAVVFFMSALVLAYRKYNNQSKDESGLMMEEEGVNQEMNQDMEDLIKLEIRRRMAQY